MLVHFWLVGVTPPIVTHVEFHSLLQCDLLLGVSLFTCAGICSVAETCLMICRRQDSCSIKYKQAESAAAATAAVDNQCAKHGIQMQC
jgi:hypothetical protein